MKNGKTLPARLKPYIILARPSHFIKNGFVFVPLFFAHRMTDGSSLASVFVGFAGFCLAASAVYVLNDIADRKKDAGHPAKRFRPVAAGTVSVPGALVFFLVLSALAGLCCLLIFQAVYALAVAAYMALNLLYSFLLQKAAGLDVCCVAAGFVLRVLAGAAVIDVPVSYRLAGLTFLLALFLAFSKRRCDQMSTGETVAGYSRNFLDGAVIVLAGCCLAGYAAYTLSPGVILEHAAPDLYLTVVWVALGLLRYLQIGFKQAKDCSPAAVFLNDRVLRLIVLLWIGTLWWMMYAGN